MEEDRIPKGPLKKRKICEVIYANPILKHKSDKDKDITINSTNFTIGRGKTCDHILGDLNVSRKHCICFLEKSTNEWFLTDYSSTGTLLNNVLLAGKVPTKLKSGDEIQLGNEGEFIYVFTSDAEPNKVQSLIMNSIDENIPSNNYIPNKRVKTEENETLILEKKALEEDLRQKTEANEKLSKEKEEIQKKLSSLTENIETNLTCAICNEMFIKSTMLNCSHAFCQWCIDKWKKTKKECPICRAKISTQKHLFTFDNIITAHFEATSEEEKNRRQEIVEERSVQELLTNRPARRGTTTGRNVRPGRPRRPRVTSTRARSHVVEIQPNEIIVLDDTQVEPTNQFPDELIEIVSDNSLSSFNEEDLFDELHMLGDMLVMHGFDGTPSDDYVEEDEDGDDDDDVEEGDDEYEDAENLIF